jgi:hypothetical protein
MTTSGGHPGFSAPAHTTAADDDPCDPGTGEARRRRARPRRRRVTAVATGACLMATALVARDWMTALDATQRADVALDQTRAELVLTEDELAAARASVDAPEAAPTGEPDVAPVDLAALQACVTGVAHALNQVAVLDSRVTGTLRAIEGTCTAAGVEL